MTIVDNGTYGGGGGVVGWQNASNAEVRAALQQLTESGRRLALECRAVVADSLTSGGQASGGANGLKKMLSESKKNRRQTQH